MNKRPMQRAGVLLWICLPLLACGVGACDDDDSTLHVLPSEIKVTNATLQPGYIIPDNGSITVMGNGFAVGDAISLTDTEKTRYDAPVKQVTDESISFGFPDGFPQKGEYTVRLHRGDEDRVLGSTSIELIYDFGVQNIEVAPSYSVMLGTSMVIAGEGFSPSDEIIFTDASTGDSFTAMTVSSDATGISITLPADMADGSYQVEMRRNGRTAQIGSTKIAQTMNTIMDPKDDTTLMGVVYCGRQPLENVVVSDGEILTRTDKDGRYWLASGKPRGTVFVSVPGHYAAPVFKGTNTPSNYALLSDNPSEVEQHNFELVAENQHNLTILGLTDAHLANRTNNDIKQFTGEFIVDVNATIAEKKADGNVVYGINLGDLSWDTYWYSESFSFADAIQEQYKVNCPVYNCMGNHDNDIQIANDWLAAQLYVKYAGPTYYSFNLGSTHVIILDNIVYSAYPGLTGASSCKYYFDDMQWQWLLRDLETIENRSNPVVVCMHHALFRYPSLDADGNLLTFVGLDNNAGNNLIEALKPFTNVRLLTGHTHVNYDGQANDGTLWEHNIAAICGTWWWTGSPGYGGNNLCRDGVPGGYGVMSFVGQKITGYDYKSTGYPANYQFRTTDLNQVHITLDRYAPDSKYTPTEGELDLMLGEYRYPSNKNEVLLTVFNYSFGWDIKVQEEIGGRLSDLKVTRLLAQDPLHAISYSLPYINKVGHYPTSGMVTVKSTKTFKVKATTPTSTLHITVTDPYGKVYTETMTRPKAFHTQMK